MKKGERRRAEILSTASGLFRQKGYRATTMQDIIEGVPCSKGSIYHHFESKLSILEALCEEHSFSSHEEFAAKRHEDGMAALESLLYYSSPFRYGEETYLSSRLGLLLMQEGAVLSEHIRRSLKTAFYDDFLALLSRLHKEGMLSWAQPALPELLWDCHVSFGEALLAEARRLIQSGGTPASRAAQMLAAARFLFERLLDLPYGSLTIIELQELLSVLDEAITRVAKEEGQLRFDAGFAVACQAEVETV